MCRLVCAFAASMQQSQVFCNVAHILPDRIFTSPEREIIKASAANLVIKIYKKK